MKREEAYQILTAFIKSPNLIKHHLAAEAAMRGLAQYFKSKGELNINAENWGIVGLLHDADYEETKDSPESHTAVLQEKIGHKLKPEVLNAIRAHAYNYNANGIEPKTLMDWSIYTCDELTGFIIAVALIRPDKKLSSVDTNSVLKRMKIPSFAKAVDRDQIKLCEEKLKIPLNEFIDIVLKAMQSINKELGL
ncbi:MAG: hypothetical protein A2905_05200 [Candidatus Levybacteria bacterium RIFCSPLOWO2_01_FULL_36_10]|nr:MAG: hypothetical protein A2905_05200 [Candidatus Levybacteria bacterium RIFCSPLOWO2_01_FULL_36_10]